MCWISCAFSPIFITYTYILWYVIICESICYVGKYYIIQVRWYHTPASRWDEGANQATWPVGTKCYPWNKDPRVAQTRQFARKSPHLQPWKMIEVTQSAFTVSSLALLISSLLSFTNCSSPKQLAASTTYQELGWAWWCQWDKWVISHIERTHRYP